MRLFNAIIKDVWKDRQGDVEQRRRALENVVRRKRERLDRVDEAFLHERSIDRETYERQRDQRREQVALAEMELNARFWISSTSTVYRAAVAADRRPRPQRSESPAVSARESAAAGRRNPDRPPQEGLPDMGRTEAPRAAAPAVARHRVSRDQHGPRRARSTRSGRPPPTPSAAAAHRHALGGRPPSQRALVRRL